MKCYYVLVNLDDYNYANARQNTTLYWHDYENKGEIYKLNPGDKITVIASGLEMETWEVTDLRNDEIFTTDEVGLNKAMSDKKIYQYWNHNFQKYFENAKGRFVKVSKSSEPTFARFKKNVPNHSIMEK